MAAPKTTLWTADPHTLAKHELLRRYLVSWLPIMARQELKPYGTGKLLLIDGFAGPGRYLGGEPGSPLVMVRALLDHDDPVVHQVEVSFLFIENDPGRVAHLEEELAAIDLPANVHVHVQQGSFDERMQEALDRIPANMRLVPTFAFIDPFGYAGKHVTLSSRILGFARCEVLIYVPLPNIARFVREDAIEEALNNLFGDDSWKLARTAANGREAEQMLHDIFASRLRTAAKHVRSFEMDGARGWSGYHLFFGSQHDMGLRKMKDAMWRVDPVSGSRFADATDPDQLIVFEPEPDLGPLRDLLRGRFGSAWFTVEQAESFVLLSTPYHPDIHLKRDTLRPMEVDGLLEATNRRKARTYPPGTRLRFIASGSKSS